MNNNNSNHLKYIRDSLLAYNLVPNTYVAFEAGDRPSIKDADNFIGFNFHTHSSTPGGHLFIKLGGKLISDNMWFTGEDFHEVFLVLSNILKQAATPSRSYQIMKHHILENSVYDNMQEHFIGKYAE